MKIRLGGMPGISGLCEETEIRYPQGVDQLLFFYDPAVVYFCREDGVDQEKEGKDHAVYGDKKQV